MDIPQNYTFFIYLAWSYLVLYFLNKFYYTALYLYAIHSCISRGIKKAEQNIKICIILTAFNATGALARIRAI